MKIYLNSVKEDWVIDRLNSEWSNLNKYITTKYILEPLHIKLKRTI